MRRIASQQSALVAFSLPLILGACATPGLPQADEPPAHPAAFLEGTWRTEVENGAWTEEFWTAPAAGSMLGGSRTFGPGAGGAPTLKFYEFLRLAAEPRGVVYDAAPLGRSPATPFTMIASESAGPGGQRAGIVFENPDHDFPTRIIYRLAEDGRLHAQVEGRENGVDRAAEWVFERAPGRRDRR